mmetsp:Transcript_1708/g.5030  ORF Transcript_1708/g.5030 Transcript_1708/m.5030 type:complete len:214 (-) Transcript_1708:491-1132(-)
MDVAVDEAASHVSRNIANQKHLTGSTISLVLTNCLPCGVTRSPRAGFSKGAHAGKPVALLGAKRSLVAGSRRNLNSMPVLLHATRTSNVSPTPANNPISVLVLVVCLNKSQNFPPTSSRLVSPQASSKAGLAYMIGQSESRMSSISTPSKAACNDKSKWRFLQTSFNNVSSNLSWSGLLPSIRSTAKAAKLTINAYWSAVKARGTKSTTHKVP